MRSRAFCRPGRPVPAVLVLALFLASCESGTDPDPNPGPEPVASVTLSADSLRILIDGQRSLATTTRDAQARLLTDRAVTWSSSNPGVATVSGGSIQAVSVGRTVIAASSEGVRAEAQVQVFDVDLKDNAVEADSLFVLTSTAAEIAQGILRYQNKGAGRTLSAGDVLVGSKPGGGAYLRKVASVSQAGGVQTAQTVATTFDQLVDSVDIEIAIKETFQSALRRDLASGHS